MEIKQRRDYIKLIEEMYMDISTSLGNIFETSPWPIIRIQTSYFLHLLFVGRTPRKENLKKKRRVPIVDFFFFTKYAIELTFLKKNFENSLDGKVLLVGFEKHESDYQNQRLNIYLHPFEFFFSELGINSQVLYLDKKSNEKRNDFERFFLKINKYNSSKLKLKSYFSSTYKLEYNKVYDISNSIKEYLNIKQIQYSETIAAIIHDSIIQNEEFYHSFMMLLKVVKPKSIINYVYYDNKMLALQRASNMLKIPLVEYQHSIQADDHLAYASWNNTDDFSYVFPSKFWVWSIKDGDRIKKNFGDKKFKPEVIIGGNVFLAQQKLKQTKSIEQYKEKGILVTLQGSWVPKFIEEVIEVQSDYTWYFRLHPRYPDDKAKLEEFYNRFPDRIEVEEANKLQLYDLFKKVQFNITSSSGTALEASSFNVTNLIFGQDGYNCFESYIKEQLFHFVSNAEDLSKLLKSQPLKNNMNKESVVLSDSKEIMDQLRSL